MTFGLFLIVAILFVPCTKIFHGKRKEIFIFTPVYISKSIELKKLNHEYGLAISGRKNTKEIVAKIANLDKYRFKRNFFLSEVVIIFLVFDIAYILLCLVISKEKKGRLLTPTQELITAVWLFFSSFWLVAAGINRRNVFLFLIVQTIFFTCLFVLLGIRKIKGRKIRQ